MRFLLLVTLLSSFTVISLSGCTEQAEPQSSPQQEAQTNQENTLPESLSGPQVLEEVTSFQHIVDSTSTWREADRQIRSRLETASPVPSKIRESAAAEAMLVAYFDTTEVHSLGPEKLEALTFYTKLFVQNRNPKSNVARPALKMLKNHWSDQRLATAIDTVIDAARNRYEITVEGIDPHIPDVHSDIRQANEQLKQLRNRLQSS